MLNGKLLDVEYYTDPIFGFQVPKTCPDVPDSVLYPADAWPNEEEYWKKYRQLAARYIDNFKKFARGLPAGGGGSGAEIAGSIRIRMAD